jgi:hypothetical protein
MDKILKSKIGHIFVILTIFSLSLFAQEELNLVKLNPDAPKETEQFGQLAGKWNAEQTIRNKDGTWSEKTTKAEWRWYYILDGHAIQDDWFSEDSTNKMQWVGTNIRIYNPEEKQWHMAWIDKTNRRLASFTAVYENGIMKMDGTNAKGRHIKNIFSNISKESFDWVQQWTFDKGKSWVEVARIHCTKKN